MIQSAPYEQEFVKHECPCKPALSVNNDVLLTLPVAVAITILPDRFR
jgi:hypothetical protein